MLFAAVQFDIAWEDKAANHAMIERIVRESFINGESTFIVLPELADTGFSMNLDAIVDDRSLPWAKNLAKHSKVFVQHGFAMRETMSGKGLNCAVILDPVGQTLGTYHKFHPFSYGKEALHYTGGNQLVLAQCGEALVCPMICYDLRFPELWRHAALHGAEVFTIGANWPAVRQQHWRALLIARAIENQAYVVAANRVGSDPYLKYSGGSMIISPKGEVLAEANDQSALISAEIDLISLRKWREDFPALQDVHRDLLGNVKIATAK